MDFGAVQKVYGKKITALDCPEDEITNELTQEPLKKKKCA